jgi:hypothetical protein
VGDVVASNVEEIIPAEMMAWLDRKKAKLPEGDNLDGVIIEAIKEIIEGHGDYLPPWEDENNPWNRLPRANSWRSESAYSRMGGDRIPAEPPPRALPQGLALKY